MVKVVFRKPNDSDCIALEKDLRGDDRQELAASSGDNALSTIRHSVRDSTLCWSVEIDEQLVCIFGCAAIGSMMSRVGSPWLLGTNQLDRHPTILMKSCRPYIVLMQQMFPHLRNYVDARNKKSVRWLRRLGFTIHPEEPYGHLGFPFHPFEMR